MIVFEPLAEQEQRDHDFFRQNVVVDWETLRPRILMPDCEAIACDQAYTSRVRDLLKHQKVLSWPG